jgi:hypothetical protein
MRWVLVTGVVAEGYACSCACASLHQCLARIGALILAPHFSCKVALTAPSTEAPTLAFREHDPV